MAVLNSSSPRAETGTSSSGVLTRNSLTRPPNPCPRDRRTLGWTDGQDSGTWRQSIGGVFGAFKTLRKMEDLTVTSRGMRGIFAELGSTADLRWTVVLPLPNRGCQRLTLGTWTSLLRKDKEVVFPTTGGSCCVREGARHWWIQGVDLGGNSWGSRSTVSVRLPT